MRATILGIMAVIVLVAADLVATACCGKATAATAATAPPKEAVDGRPWSRRDGDGLIVQPTGWRLDLPHAWVVNDRPGTEATLRCARGELDAAPPEREWQSEFRRVADAAFGRDRLAFVGSRNANGIAVPSLALYVLPDGFPDMALHAAAARAGAELGRIGSPAEKRRRDTHGEITEEAAREMLAEAQRLDAEGTPARPTIGLRGAWCYADFAMPLQYGDYGGTAWIELRVRRLGGVLAACAMMCDHDPAAGDPPELAGILASLR